MSRSKARDPVASLGWGDSGLYADQDWPLLWPMGAALRIGTDLDGLSSWVLGGWLPVLEVRGNARFRTIDLAVAQMARASATPPGQFLREHGGDVLNLARSVVNRWGRGRNDMRAFPLTSGSKVYLIATTEPPFRFKVGISTDPERRLQTMSVGSPLNLCLVCSVFGTSWDERRIHAQLREHRVRGEWFDVAALSQGEALVRALQVDRGRP